MFYSFVYGTLLKQCMFCKPRFYGMRLNVQPTGIYLPICCMTHPKDEEEYNIGDCRSRGICHITTIKIEENKWEQEQRSRPMLLTGYIIQYIFPFQMVCSVPAVCDLVVCIWEAIMKIATESPHAKIKHITEKKEKGKAKFNRPMACLLMMMIRPVVYAM